MKNKTVLVTGATSGIGLATAKLLLEQGVNQLIITGKNAQRLASAKDQLGQGVLAIQCDNEKLSDIEKLADILREKNIRLDGLVLNAGIFEPQPMKAIDEIVYQRTMDVNFKAPLFTVKLLSEYLNNPSSVVFISSIAVHKAFETAAVYSASKAAFESAMAVMNVEFAGLGVRINCIRPGVTATDIQAKAGLSETEIAEFFDSLKESPIGRVLTADDIAGGVSYLLSDSSLALRNARIDIDGGTTL